MRAVLLAVLLAALAPGRARGDGCPDGRVGFAAGPVVLPFTLADGQIRFAVRIAGVVKPLTFTLDTGASVSYLDRDLAHRLGLRGGDGGTVRGAGREPIHVERLDHVTFTVAGLATRDHLVNLAGLKRDAADPVDGFWGADFIARFVITVDYGAGKLTIADRCGYDYRGKGAVVPIAFNAKQLPFVPGTIAVDGKQETSQLLVDSGSGDAVGHPLIRRAKGPLRHIKMGVGLGAGTSDAVIGHADWFELGGFRMRGALTACCGPNADTHYALGTEVLRRFTVIFDYAHKRMILEPNAHLDDPFPDA